MNEADFVSDESDHFFLRYVNKKLRNLTKKLREIETLEVSAVPLKKEQKEKLHNKQKILEEKKQFESMKIAYHQAEKDFPPTKMKHEEAQDIRVARKEADMMIPPFFNLIHLSQLWLQCSYSNNLPELKNNQEIMQDLGILSEFYHKIFFIPQGVEFLSIEEKKIRYQEIEDFLRNSEGVAVKGVKYSTLGDIVKKYDNLDAFFKKKEEVEHSVGVTEETKSASLKEETVHLKETLGEAVQLKETPAMKEEPMLDIKRDIEENIKVEDSSEVRNKDTEEKKEVAQEQQPNTDRENKRKYKADSSKKYQLMGGDKSHEGYSGRYSKNAYNNVQKRKGYVVEYVEKKDTK